MSREWNSCKNIKQTRMVSNRKLNKLRKICGLHGNTPGTTLFCDLMPDSFKGTPNTLKRLKFITNRKCFCDLKVPKEELCTHRTRATSSLEHSRSSVLEEHNYFLNKKTSRDLQDAVTVFGAICDDLQNEVESLRRTVIQRDKCISRFHAILMNKTIEEKIPLHRLTWRQFSKNPRALKAFTGFNSERKLQKFMNTVRPVYDFNKAAQVMQFILPLEDQIFLVLSHFKFGSSQKHLMHKFNMMFPAMEKTLEFWLDLLHRQLTRIRVWPRRVANKPRKLIIDFAKVFVDYSESDRREKTLLGLTPDGVICFVSDRYPDEYSEVEVAEKCGILKLVESGDEIFADDAFLIENLIQDGVKLSRPLDARKDPILCQEIIRSKNVAERAIRNIRGYKILEMPNFYGKSSRIFQICCHLVNFNRDDFLERKIICD